MAFVTEAALIALREGLEALLITGILLGLVTRLGRPDARKHVWLGFASAVGVSVLAGWVIQRYLFTAFEASGGGAWFELIAALLAVATLTYMVFWMWSHTTQVIAQAKDKVATALTAGSLVTIVFITFISVVREGLETVLFYSALAGQYTPLELAWSGLVGFAVSAGLVYLVLKTSRKVGLKRFFTATGIFLLIVAAMLLTHVVGAITELGWIDPQPALWDTSAAIADDSIVGRVLHATMGYTATPSLLQAVLYFGYLFIAGGAYLWVNGIFHRSTTEGRQLLGRRVAVALVAVLLIASVVGAGAANPTDTISGHSHGAGTEAGDGHDHPDASIPEGQHVAVVLRNHGEPIHYNETTYRSFAQFTKHLLETLGMEALLEVDQGTVLIDKAHPFERGPRLDATYMDAWLDTHPGPAVYTGSPFPDTQEVPVMDGYYLMPGGPGLGEPDILESAGLSAYTAWLQMENTSPMHAAKTAVLDRVTQLLQERHGAQVSVFSTFSIRPYVGPNSSFSAIAEQVTQAQPDLVVDAYTSHLHSDIMDTCMMQPRFAAALAEAGYDGPVIRPGPSGLTGYMANGTAEHVVERVDAYPDDARVAVFLTHHGMTPGSESVCQDRKDPYNAQAEAMFEATEAAIETRLGDREVKVLQVYGQGAGEQGDGVFSPQEALEEADAWNATQVIDVPYELPGDGYDNLVNHRLNYGLDPAQAPHYDGDHETHLTRYGMQVTITSSAFATEDRALAQLEVIEHALADHLGGAEEASG